MLLGLDVLGADCLGVACYHQCCADSRAQGQACAILICRLPEAREDAGSSRPHSRVALAAASDVIGGLRRVLRSAIKSTIWLCPHLRADLCGACWCLSYSY